MKIEIRSWRTVISMCEIWVLFSYSHGVPFTVAKEKIQFTVLQTHTLIWSTAGNNASWPISLHPMTFAPGFCEDRWLYQFRLFLTIRLIWVSSVWEQWTVRMIDLVIVDRIIPNLNNSFISTSRNQFIYLNLTQVLEVNHLHWFVYGTNLVIGHVRPAVSPSS